MTEDASFKKSCLVRGCLAPSSSSRGVSFTIPCTQQAYG
jgi:hypothetical protein